MNLVVVILGVAAMVLVAYFFLGAYFLWKALFRSKDEKSYRNFYTLEIKEIKKYQCPICRKEYNKMSQAASCKAVCREKIERLNRK